MMTPNEIKKKLVENEWALRRGIMTSATMSKTSFRKTKKKVWVADKGDDSVVGKTLKELLESAEEIDNRLEVI